MTKRGIKGGKEEGRIGRIKNEWKERKENIAFICKDIHSF